MASEVEKKRSVGDPRGGRLLRYDVLTIVLHWTIALLIAANLLLALRFEGLEGAARGQLIRIHKSIGVTILALALLRLLWRFVRPPPPLDAELGASTRRWAKAMHAVLLWLPLILALSGWAMISADKGAYRTVVFGLFELPKIGLLVTAPAHLRETLHVWLGGAHLWLALLLVVLVAGHIGAAVKHQFLDGMRQFERMTPRLRRGAPSARRLDTASAAPVRPAGE